MRVELIELQKQLKTTFVYVTHDQVEAMSMADVIVLMHRGAILQQGTPEEIYNNPNSTYIAQFIGSPAMNIIDLADGSKLGYRPEKVHMTKGPAGARYHRPGKVVTREMLGSETISRSSWGKCRSWSKARGMICHRRGGARLCRRRTPVFL
jgi:sn-glycerol 3-phosphate transport system ATP-binding protein